MTRATVDLSVPPFVPSRLALGVALMLACLAMAPASALVVMNIDPSGNYVAPTTTTLTGYTDVDPGWANATTRGVYLGNGWVLSAAHTGIVNGQAETINGQNYGVIKDSSRNLKNPTSLVNAGVVSTADLRLVRLNTLSQFDGSPEQRAAILGLPLQPIHLTTSRLANDQQLMIIGNGRIKADGSTLRHADANYVSGQVPAWSSFTTCVSCFHTLGTDKLHAVGYNTSNIDRQTWGTNRVENPSDVSNRLSGFESKGGAWVSSLTTSNGTITSTTAMQAFDFDEYGFTMDVNGNVIGGGGNEVQAGASDSGSGVYAWNTGLGRWELSGVMHAIAQYGAGNQAMAIRRGTSPFGDLTTFSDISVYRTQIEAYMAPPVGYAWTGQGEDTRFFSMTGRNVAYDAGGALVVTEGRWGDVNLDGIVSGDGSGAWATDDVTAFVDGWGYQQAAGDILSWKRGDLNQDGKTNLDDFLLLRTGVQQASGVSLSLSALFGSTPQVVPEPTAAMLLLSAGFGLLAWRKLARAR